MGWKPGGRDMKGTGDEGSETREARAIHLLETARVPGTLPASQLHSQMHHSPTRSSQGPLFIGNYCQITTIITTT